MKLVKYLCNILFGQKQNKKLNKNNVYLIFLKIWIQGKSKKKTILYIFQTFYY
jgi:hypothetical protein